MKKFTIILAVLMIGVFAANEVKAQKYLGTQNVNIILPMNLNDLPQSVFVEMPIKNPLGSYYYPPTPYSGIDYSGRGLIFDREIFFPNGGGELVGLANTNRPCSLWVYVNGTNSYYIVNMYIFQR